eukprot:665915-Ditylum_brightwellii.AAC.1
MRISIILTRLVIPTVSFTATLSKIRYLGVKKIFDKEGVNYSKYAIQQAPDLKTKLEMINLKQGEKKYHNYKGVVDEAADIEEEDNNGLAIRAFEVGFCTDVGATFVYEMCEGFIDKLKYAGFHQDSGLAILE